MNNILSEIIYTITILLFLELLDMETNRIDVHVQEGKLVGTIEKNIHGNKYFSFRGIPYAKPPLGDLRFKVDSRRFIIIESSA